MISAKSLTNLGVNRRVAKELANSNAKLSTLSIPAAGPFPTPVVTDTFTTFPTWTNVGSIGPFTYEGGVLTANQGMTAFFALQLNFAPVAEQFIEARVETPTSEDFEGAITGSAGSARETISIVGTVPLKTGETLAVQLRDPAGPAVIVIQGSTWTVTTL